jgi:hypothetical protein
MRDMKQFVGGTIALTIASSAMAGLTIDAFTDRALWQEVGPELLLEAAPKGWTAQSQSYAMAGSMITDGAVTGGSDWSAFRVSPSAGGALGFMEQDRNYLSPGQGAALIIDFTAMPGSDGSGVYGFGGDFAVFSPAGQAEGIDVIATMSDGTTAVSKPTAGNSPTFVGFWLTSPGVTITQVEMRVYASKNPTEAADFEIGMSRLYAGFAGTIPAPGAVALLGAAGLIAVRRRRAN